jgi:sterol desaturase/sphingolipid hydroxylase (fatty acid hydroxylase superfamily)
MTEHGLILLRVAYYSSMTGTFCFLLFWEAGNPLVPTPARRWRHVVRNLVLFILLVAITDGVVGDWLLDIPAWLTDPPPGLLTTLQLPVLALVAIAFVLADLTGYLLHRLFHRWRWLWLLHSVHHADPHVDVTTGLRHHPIEGAVEITIKVGVYLLFGIPLWIEGARALLLNPLIMFQHANVDYPPWLERALSWLLVTPAMHRVHHSPEAIETNSNYGSVLTVWDHLFGTYRRAGPVREPRYGLRNLTADSWQSIAGMLLAPIRARRIASL